MLWVLGGEAGLGMSCPKCGAPDSLTDTCGFCGHTVGNLRKCEQLAVLNGFEPTGLRRERPCAECHNGVRHDRWENKTTGQGAWIPELHRRGNGNICPEGL